MPRTFPLRPGAPTYFVALIFGSCTALFVQRALTTEGSSFRVGGQSLGADGNVKFFALLAIVAGLVTLATIASIIRWSGGRHAVVLDDDAITVPGSFLRPKGKIIRRADVVECRLERLTGHARLMIVHLHGRSSIVKHMVGGEAFDQIIADLAARHRLVPSGW